MQRPSASGRGHASGRLRARCGSKAQQSCVPATAPRMHVMKQQSDGDAMKKSMANGSKINQNSIKNGPKVDQKSSKIEVWNGPGQVWRRLGPSWAIQSVFGGILDCLGSVLEASWRGLGGLLGGLWPRKVANMAPQNGAKIN